MEVQFNEINWASGVSLNITTRTSDSLASFTGQIEVETSIEIDFPSNENELTFEFQINEGSSKEMEINDASELYNITVRQIQCSNKGAFTNYIYKIWLFLTTYPPPFTFPMV